MPKHKCDDRSVERILPSWLKNDVASSEYIKTLGDCLPNAVRRRSTIFRLQVALGLTTKDSDCLLHHSVMVAGWCCDAGKIDQTQTHMMGLHAEGLKTPWNRTWIIRIETNPPDGHRWSLSASSWQYLVETCRNMLKHVGRLYDLGVLLRTVQVVLVASMKTGKKVD